MRRLIMNRLIWIYTIYKVYLLVLRPERFLYKWTNDPDNEAYYILVYSRLSLYQPLMIQTTA